MTETNPTSNTSNADEIIPGQTPEPDLAADPDHGADGGADAGADPDHGADGGADAGAGADPDHGADGGADAGAGAPV